MFTSPLTRIKSSLICLNCVDNPTLITIINLKSEITQNFDYKLSINPKFYKKLQIHEVPHKRGDNI